MSILYAISIGVLTAYGVNLLWLSYRFARTDMLKAGPVPEPGALPSPLPEWPRVTVQLPFYNEPLVAERLIDACARLDYPAEKLEIQVLDDSVDATPDIVASRVAFWQRRGIDMTHVRRFRRDGFKAGALANGLQLARGRLIAIFDADFVPQPDFLKRLLPVFADDRLGVVQARWGHLNADASLLTRLQSVGLDTHFAVEQRTRNRSDCFMNFNGTAGIWRRACIDDAGGWQGDTIAEDLDLSYRAQLAGWQFRFLDDVAVPAELPSTMSGLRTQQSRWAKGSIETARKLLGPLWASDMSSRRKIQGSVHLTAHAVFPFVLLAALLHAPLLASEHAGSGPGEMYFGWMALGLLGFAGFALAQVLAQRHLYVEWPRRLRFLPAFMAGTIGMCISNTRAVIEALIGRRSAFVRTPKFGDVGPEDDGREAPPQRDAESEPLAEPVRSPRWTLVALLEMAMLAYTVGGVVYLGVIGEWAALPFQILFAAGFGLVVLATFRTNDVRRRARSSTVA
ncbi:MAG: glycosyltransferase [Rhodothermales bacterium]